jgi:hypothetical protein
MDHKAELVLTRKAKHERCDIRRAASVMNTSVRMLEDELDSRGFYETEHYSLTKVVKDQ